MLKISHTMLTALGILVLVVMAAASAPVAAQTCGPLDNGRLADVFYEGTALFFDPTVEYREMVLTITGPCEDIVRTFGPNDTISFDIREIERVVDGRYNWQLKRRAADPDLEEELQSYRGSGEEDSLWWGFFQGGKIPAGPYTDSGSFSVVEGRIIDPDFGVEKSTTIAARGLSGPIAGAAGGTEVAGGSDGNTLATKDTVLTNANGVIRNSLCVGFDCANSNTYSDTTILLRENNTRIKFDDTSTINSFPRRDWEIEANSNLNGGASYLGFNDCGESSGGGCATDLVFAVEAGVRQNALYVESDGDVGFGTANPVVRLHTIDGDTPALRLEQDGSSGFAPQTWDVAGNETSFFVRDATNGSTLPFRIRPGASSNTLVIHDDKVGVGLLSPTEELDVKSAGSNQNVMKVTRSSSSDQILRVFETSSGGGLLSIFDSAGNEDFRMSAEGDTWFASAGQVGIGCTNPDSDLTVGGNSNCNTAPFSKLNAGDSTFTVSSSRTLKENLKRISPEGIVEKIAGIGVYKYDFIDGPADKLGLMAEDFYRIFGRGSDEMLNGQEVQMALWLAVQELASRVEEAEIKELNERNAELLSRQKRLEQEKDAEIEELKVRVQELEEILKGVVETP